LKINDRILLGMISGFVGNVGKDILMRFAEKKGYATKNFADVAASFFLAAKEVRTPAGRLVGILSDYSTAITIGIANIYLLTLSGKDYWFAKGLGAGSVFWAVMYGFLGSLGKNNPVYPVTAKTALSSCLGHTLFGILCNYVAVKLGDDSLFRKKTTAPKYIYLKRKPSAGARRRKNSTRHNITRAILP